MCSGDTFFRCVIFAQNWVNYHSAFSYNDSALFGPLQNFFQEVGTVMFGFGLNHMFTIGNPYPEWLVISRIIILE